MFNDGLRSWRRLLVHYVEFGACQRNEPSGSLHGLMRTRAFEQDDAHVLCREDDVPGEAARFIGLLSPVYSDLGFPEYAVVLSTRSTSRAPTNSESGTETRLGDAARRCGVAYSVQPSEGALYGPKLEFALRDRYGRSWDAARFN